MSGLCVVMSNLKVRNLGGFPSNGMVLFASSDDHNTLELIRPPKGSKPGERVFVQEPYGED